ncbi:MAG: alpha/beta fold hydrolase [Candidatus Lernaella stagnicola]|nr:alpha/beta fold hydrolase [Candidatus Lernaella stagnicola]
MKKALPIAALVIAMGLAAIHFMSGRNETPAPFPRSSGWPWQSIGCDDPRCLNLSADYERLAAKLARRPQVIEEGRKLGVTLRRLLPPLPVEADSAARLEKRERGAFGSCRATDILLRDPVLGDLPALLVTPARAAPGAPAVLAFHGHGQSPEVFVTRSGLAELCERGYFVLAPTLRAAGGRPHEDRAARALLAAGSSKLEAHVLEARLWLRYLQERERVGRCGFVGHSLGGCVGTLLAWLDVGFTAVVSDYHSVFEGQASDGVSYLSERDPRLAPLASYLNELHNAPVSALHTSYGLTQRDEIRAFLDRHLVE